MTDESASRPSGPRFPPAFLIGLLSILCFPLLFGLIVLLNQFMKLGQFGAFLIVLSFIAGFVLGIVAWILAARKLKKIPDGVESTSVRSRLKGGRVLGILGSFLFTPIYLLVMTYFSGSNAPPEYYVESDMHNIASDAKQYRLDPGSAGKRRESYVGYTLPDYFRRNLYAEYTVTAIGNDSLTVVAVFSADTLSRLTAVIGPWGMIDRWERTGLFTKEIR